MLLAGFFNILVRILSFGLPAFGRIFGRMDPNMLLFLSYYWKEDMGREK